MTKSKSTSYKKTLQQANTCKENEPCQVDTLHTLNFLWKNWNFNWGHNPSPSLQHCCNRHVVQEAWQHTPPHWVIMLRNEKMMINSNKRKFQNPKKVMFTGTINIMTEWLAQTLSESKNGFDWQTTSSWAELPAATPKAGRQEIDSSRRTRGALVFWSKHQQSL